MSRARDISIILGKTEVVNTSNTALGTSSSSGLDSASVQTIGLQKFDTLDSLPSASLTSGQQAWVESSGRLYISNGSGWYNVALVNASPTLTLDQSGTITLNAETLSVTVTASAVDSDDNQGIITFSVESDGNMVGTGTTVSQDSSVFTITALSADSGGVAGNFTLTFKATDQIAVDNEALSFSLSFSNVVDSSAETVLLMKARDSDATNTNITFLDSNQSSIGFTEYSAPTAGSFSPYRPGGYSAHFDGTGDRLEMTAISDLSATNYTIEMWVYPEVDLNSDTYIFMENSDDGTAGHVQFYTVSGGTTLRFTERGDGTNKTDVTMDFEAYKWYHLAVVWDGSNTNIYVDGVSKGSSSNNAVAGAGNGLTVNGDGAGSYQWPGYVRDFRISTTARYTGNFTPPTEALTSDSDTDVLLCHAPYFGDGSTNNRTVISEGQVSTQPFGPYDYEPWVDSDYGGSVTFDGTDDYIVAATSGGFGFLTGDFTIEMWVYADLTASGDYLTSFGFNNQGINHAADKFRYYHGTLGGSNVMYTTGATGHAYSWNHVAVTRESGTTRIFANGKLGSSTTVSHNWPDYAIALGCTEAGTGAFMFNGHIADARYVKGTALYTADFTPPTAPLPHVSGTVLRMNNKSDANIYDATASSNFTVVNNALTSTTQRKFTTSSSVYFDGTTDYVWVPWSEANNLSNAIPFTIEGWFYFDTVASDQHFIHAYENGSGYDGFALALGANSNPGTTLCFWDGATWRTFKSDVAADTWYHIAVVNDASASNNTKVYVDGTQSGSAFTVSSQISRASTVPISVGCYYQSTQAMDGYVQDFRITNGLARYTAAFTPPTAEFEL